MIINLFHASNLLFLKLLDIYDGKLRFAKSLKKCLEEQVALSDKITKII